MDEIYGESGLRLSQIIDPITSLVSDFDSNSASCSSRLGARVHKPYMTAEEGSGVSPSGSDRLQVRSNAHDSKQIGSESPRLIPRRAFPAPVRPPRPHNAKCSSVVFSRDSPYVNVSNLIFRKKDSFTQVVTDAGCVELKDTNSSISSSSNYSKSCKYSPYDFISEPSGYMDYTDKRINRARKDFHMKCFEIKANDTQKSNSVNSTCDPGSPGRVDTYKRSFSSCSRQCHDDQSRHCTAENQIFMDRTSLSLSTVEEEKPSTTYSASESCDGFLNTVEEFNWQERCLELQLELHRSKSQATRIRDMLREKVSNI